MRRGRRRRGRSRRRRRRGRIRRGICGVNRRGIGVGGRVARSRRGVTRCRRRSIRRGVGVGVGVGGGGGGGGGGRGGFGVPRGGGGRVVAGHLFVVVHVGGVVVVMCWFVFFVLVFYLIRKFVVF